MPKPSTLTDVRSFLRLIQFFRRFIKSFSEIAAPHTNLTKKDKGVQKWNDQWDQAFESLKKAVTSAPILVSPNWEKHVRGQIDASQLPVGGTLKQFDDEGHDRVIAYFSKKLNRAGRDYTANYRELLGLIFFLNRFRCYLGGTSFEICTDDQLLKHFFLQTEVEQKGGEMVRNSWQHSYLIQGALYFRLAELKQTSQQPNVKSSSWKSTISTTGAFCLPIRFR